LRYLLVWPCLNYNLGSHYNIPLTLLAFSLIAALSIALALYLRSPHTSAIMPQDLKKLYPQAKATKTGAVTANVPGVQKPDGETIPRRNVKVKDGLRLKPADDINTLYDILRYSSAKFGNAKAMGSRKVIDIHEETKKIKKMVDGKQQEVDKKWQYFELSPFKYMSFVEFEKMALTAGAGLKHLGLVPEDRVHLFAATSSQWLTMAHGNYDSLLVAVCC
jgi:long-chain acyl-CoA synthetase